MHPYYAVVIAPAIAALVGGGLAEWHRLRDGRLVADVVLATTVVATVIVADVILERTPDFLPGLGIAVMVIGVAAGALLVIGGGVPRGRAIAIGGLALALVAVLAGPASYAVDSVTSPYAGGDPAAGPSGASHGAGPFGGRSLASLAGAPGATAEIVNQPLVDYLVAHRGASRWIVAAESASGAAWIQIATGAPVMEMGGFTGGDRVPSAEQLAAYVATGELRYVYVNGPGGFPGAAGGPGGFPGVAGGVPGGLDPVSTAGRRSWVAANCTRVDFGGAAGTLYDCAPGG